MGDKGKIGKTMIFGKHVKGLRDKYNIFGEALCEGLCIRQEFNRPEKGAREPGYFLREAVLGRLGVEGDLYEHFLNDTEIRQFEKRKEILENILWNRMDRTEELLEAYRFEYVGDAFAERRDISIRQEPVEKISFIRQ